MSLPTRALAFKASLEHLYAPGCGHWEPRREVREGTVVPASLESFPPRASVPGTGWAVWAALILSRVIYRVTRGPWGQPWSKHSWHRDWGRGLLPTWCSFLAEVHKQAGRDPALQHAQETRQLPAAWLHAFQPTGRLQRLLPRLPPQWEEHPLPLHAGACLCQQPEGSGTFLLALDPRGRTVPAGTGLTGQDPPLLSVQDRGDWSRVPEAQRSGGQGGAFPVAILGVGEIQ